MKVTLTFNGETFNIEMDENEAKKLIASNKPKSGYERVRGEEYWYDGGNGYVNRVINDVMDIDDDTRYEAGNYYKTEELATNNARADRLMRNLRRFAADHNETDPWKNPDDYLSLKYGILYDYREKHLDVTGWQGWRFFTPIWFSSEAIARKAIEVYRNELLWYFTGESDDTK